MSVFIHLHVTLIACFKANFIKENRVLSYSYTVVYVCVLNCSVCQCSILWCLSVFIQNNVINIHSTAINVCIFRPACTPFHSCLATIVVLLQFKFKFTMNE